MNEQQHDKEFEAFLAGKSKLKRPWRQLGNEQPPAEVDQRILAEARKVTNNRREDLGPRGGWLKPAALAVTVLLSFSVVMNIGVDTSLQDDQVLPAASPTKAARQAESMTVETFAEEKTFAESPADRTPPADERALSAPLPASAAPAESAEIPVEMYEIDVTARKQSMSVQDVPIVVGTSAAEEDIAVQETALAIVREYVALAGRDTAAPDTVTSRLAGSPSAAPATGTVTAGEPLPSATDAGAGRNTETDPESQLREIVRLNDVGEQSRALALLDEFLVRFPEHPVSVKLQSETQQP